MTYEIKTEKAFDGWTAKSESILEETAEGKRVLKLRTSKVRGGLDACATVCIRKDQGGFACETYALFEDFNKRGIAPTPCKRVTEKAVLTVHKLALTQMDSLIAEAKKFYGIQSPQNT